MSQHYAPANSAYRLKHNFALKEFSQTSFLSRFPVILGTFTTLLLALLLLRITLVFFSIESPVQSVLTPITNPFVAPFNVVLSDFNAFIPIAAMIAYIVYYSLYWVTTWTLRSFSNSSTRVSTE